MSYISSHLLPNEQVLYQAKPHWVIFMMPALWTLLAIPFINQTSLLIILGYIFLFLAFVAWISSVVTYCTSEYGLTNKRVIVKVGFLRRHSVEILLQRIESIQISQSLFGRLLGYGTIFICGTGGSKDPFHRIENPLAFRRKVQEQLEQLLTSKSTGNL